MRDASRLAALIGTTRRQRSALAVVVGLGLAVVMLALLRQWTAVAAGVGLLLTGALLAHLDMRRRFGQFRRSIAGYTAAIGMHTDTVEQTRREVRTLSDAQAAVLGELSTLRGAIETERRYLASERRKQEEFRRLTVNLVRRQPQELEALLQLFGRVTPSAPMPPSGGWALEPAGLLNLYSLVERRRPGLALELGSGTSTVWIGYALAGLGGGRLISLDHLESYAGRTRAAIDLHGLSASVEVRYAQLHDLHLGDEWFQWYDLNVLSDLHDIDFVFVDGPPGSTGRGARYPALPALIEKLADGALLVLDDIDRNDERQIVERWLKETPGLTHEVALVGNQAVLRYHTDAAAIIERGEG
jgi:predicted O-methyltransferase YrrM